MKKMLKFFQKEWVLITILIILTAATRIPYFGHPDEVVFDEVYFARWSTNYFKGEFYFDIHPPLAKMILAATGKIFGFDETNNTDFSQIGNKYKGDFYKLFRAVEMFFSLILVLAVYGIGKRLFYNKWPGFLASLFIIFDNAILVQSRYIFTDIFLLAFGALGIYFVLRLRDYKKLDANSFPELFLASLFLTASVLVKWTALVFVAVGALILLLDRISHKKFQLFIKESIIMFVIFVLVYFGVFAIHLLSLPYTGGPNHDAFLSPQSQSALLGNQYYGKYEPPNLIKRIIELNAKMFAANASIKQSHPYSSKWYSWPIMYRPIFEWHKNISDQTNERIYLIGNPLIWWLGFLCVIFVIFALLYELRFKDKTIYFQPLLILTFGYLLNLLPYVFITRPAFIYHYFPSFIFMTLISGFLLWFFLRTKPLILIVIFIVIIQSFLYFAPLSYGLSLTDQQYLQRLWLPTWR